MPPELFFICCRCLFGHGLGEALVYSATRLEVASKRTVTHLELLLGERITKKVYGPSRFQVAKVGRMVVKQGMEMLIEGLALARRSSGFGRVVKPIDTLLLIGFEPGAHGLLIAVKSVSNLWDAEPLGTE